MVNDIEPDQQAMTVALVKDAGHGTVTLADDGGFAYEPDDGFIGLDTFNYTASDGSLTSAPATVSFEVEVPPILPILLLILDDD